MLQSFCEFVEPFPCIASKTFKRIWHARGQRQGGRLSESWNSLAEYLVVSVSNKTSCMKISMHGGGAPWAHWPRAPQYFRDGETAIKIKFALFGGIGGREGDQCVSWESRKKIKGNRNRGNRSERFWGVLGSLKGSLRGSERPSGDLWEDPLVLENWSQECHLSEVSGHPLRAPLRVPFSSQSCGFCCP